MPGCSVTQTYAPSTTHLGMCSKDQQGIQVSHDRTTLHSSSPPCQTQSSSSLISSLTPPAYAQANHHCLPIPLFCLRLEPSRMQEPEFPSDTQLKQGFKVKPGLHSFPPEVHFWSFLAHLSTFDIFEPPPPTKKSQAGVKPLKWLLTGWNSLTNHS